MLQPRSSDRHPSTRNLTGWVIGFGCSVLADQTFFLSLAWAAVQLGVPGLVGLVLAAGAVPRLLALLVGGAMADSRSPKRIIIGTDSGRALAMVAAALLLFLGSLDAWALVAVAAVVGTLDGLFLPAVAALPVRVAPPHLMGRVSALRTITQRVGMLGGGPLAGWLIYTSGPAAAFIGAAVLFLLSVGSLARVSLTAAARPGQDKTTSSRPVADHAGPPRSNLIARTGTDMAQGFRVVRRNTVLASLLLLIGGMNFGFSGPFTAGIPLLADAEGWGARGAGLLIGAFGVGAAVSGVGLFFLKRVPRAGLVQLGALLVMGLSAGAIGVGRSLAFALAAAVVLGLASGVFGTVVYALLLSAAPADEVGRVMALLSLTLEGSAALSFLATGVLAPALGVGVPFLCGAGVIVAVTVVGTLQPAVRRLRTDPPARDEPAPPSEGTAPAPAPAVVASSA